MDGMAKNRVDACAEVGGDANLDYSTVDCCRRLATWGLIRLGGAVRVIIHYLIILLYVAF